MFRARNLFEILLNEAPTPKNIGRISKHKDAIKRRLNGNDSPPEESGSESSSVKPTPKNVGNIAKYRKTLKGKIKSKPTEEPAETEEAPTGKMYDDIEVEEEEEASTDAEITGEEPVEVEEPTEGSEEIDPETDEVEEEVEDNTPKGRLLSIDRTKINKELKQLCLQPALQIPINKIKEILAKFELILVDEDGREDVVKLIGLDGNTDVELAYKSGKRIGNSALVLFWSQIDRSEQFEFHAYLS